MGLDMFLYAKRYISKYSDEDLEKSIKADFSELSENFEVKYVIVEVGYWRKANAIHQWFVENIQDDNDDCRNYYVSREQLVELLTLCQNARNNLEITTAQLAPKSGFFFGSTEVDDYYWETIDETIQIINSALELPHEWEFEYSSSW